MQPKPESLSPRHRLLQVSGKDRLSGTLVLSSQVHQLPAGSGSRLIVSVAQIRWGAAGEGFYYSYCC